VQHEGHLGGITILDLPGTSGGWLRLRLPCCRACARSPLSLQLSCAPHCCAALHSSPCWMCCVPLAAPHLPCRPLPAGHPRPHAASAQQRRHPGLRPQPVGGPRPLPAHHGAQWGRQDQHPEVWGFESTMGLGAVRWGWGLWWVGWVSMYVEQTWRSNWNRDTCPCFELTPRLPSAPSLPAQAVTVRHIPACPAHALPAPFLFCCARAQDGGGPVEQRQRAHHPARAAHGARGGRGACAVEAWLCVGQGWSREASLCNEGVE